MLYFAYGSNLNHFQMKRRCKDSVFIKKINLKDFNLTFRSKYKAADIEYKKGSIVPGGLFEISMSDEKKLDVYEDFPILYKKFYFTYQKKKMTMSIYVWFEILTFRKKQTNKWRARPLSHLVMCLYFFQI